MDFRFHRLKLAVAGSVAVKALGLAIQILAYPVAIDVLGVERFGVFVVLNAALTFIQLSNLGIGPGLTMKMSAASARNDKTDETRLFSTAFFLLLGITILITLFGVIVAYTVPLGDLFGQTYSVSETEVRLSFLVLVLIIASQILLSVGVTARGGYLEHYKNSIFNAIGHVASIVLLLFMVPRYPTIPMFIIAVNGCITFAQLLNLSSLILLERRYLFPRASSFRSSSVSVLLGTGTGFLLMRLGHYFTLHVTSIILGTIGGAVAVAQFAIVLRIVYTLWGITNMFTGPFWPALSNAVVTQDARWAKVATKRLIAISTFYAIVGGAMLALVGDQIVRIWIGTDVQPSKPMFIFLGLYFFLSTWGHVMDTIVIGTGRVWPVALSHLGQGILTAGATALLIETTGPYGAAIALCLGALCGHVWLMPLVARREFRRLEVSQHIGAS